MENLALEHYIWSVCCKWGMAEAPNMSWPPSAAAGCFYHGTRCCGNVDRPVCTCPGCCCCTLPAGAPSCRHLGRKGELLFGWSSVLPSQITTYNNSVSSGLWWGPCIHEFLLMWLLGWLNSFPNHSLPVVVILAHLSPSCSPGSAPWFRSRWCVNWKKWGGVGSAVRSWGQELL